MINEKIMIDEYIKVYNLQDVVDALGEFTADMGFEEFGDQIYIIKNFMEKEVNIIDDTIADLEDEVAFLTENNKNLKEEIDELKEKIMGLVI